VPASSLGRAAGAARTSPPYGRLPPIANIVSGCAPRDLGQFRSACPTRGRVQVRLVGSDEPPWAIVNEEWLHRLYAERDLAVLEERGRLNPD